MSRISSMFFMLALAFYYIPKFLGKKNRTFIRMHIYCGIISTIAMLVAFVQAFGTEDIIKYLGFAAVMIAISLTGYLIKKARVFLKMHLVSTILFFVYLFCSIKFL